MRKPVLALVVAMLAALGAYGPVAAAQTSNAKVVIIVGADTPQYLDDANEVYAEAIQHTPNVVRVYSPNATWTAVKNAVVGANVVIYLGHGNGWPSPYTYDPSYTTKNGFGLNATAAGTHYNLKYYGEPSIRTLDFAPNAIVFFHHLCYASGNSESSSDNPTLATARARVDNYGAAFLAAGASAVIADGHSHTPYYLRALFTQHKSLLDLWRGAPNYHRNDISFTPSRSTGAGFLDPDTGGSYPKGYYRSIVGGLSVTTDAVLGRLPRGAVVVPAKDGVSVTGGTSVRTRTTSTVTRTSTTPTRTR
ncbi:MAG TPA: hypothetical protein VF231_08235 [Candidatus Limnocylindrales bacterium]